MKTVVFFMSGSGTNVEKILERVYDKYKDKFNFVIYTDNVECRADEIATNYGLPYYANDLKLFYKNRNYKSTSLLQENGFNIRAEWTYSVWNQLKPTKPVLGIFAGFETLCNICRHFRCINVHPGDLTQEFGGHRRLIGLGTRPIKEAMRLGYKTMRSTVIEVDPVYKFEDMDSGKILDISPEVPILTWGAKMEDLITEPKLFEKAAELNLQYLKENGDWVVFPRAVENELKKLVSG